MIPFKKFIPAIICFVVIMVLICLPGDKVPSPKFLLDISFDKIVHIGLFGSFAFLLFYPVAKAPLSMKNKIQWLLVIVLSTSAFGYGTELIQKFFIPLRSYDLADWAADSMGALLAFIFCRFVLLRRKA
jgi:VanZ family protein